MKGKRGDEGRVRVWGKTSLSAPYLYAARGLPPPTTGLPSADPKTKRQPFNSAAPKQLRREDGAKRHEDRGNRTQNHRATCPRLALQRLVPCRLVSLQDMCPPRARGLLSNLWIPGYSGPSAVACL